MERDRTKYKNGDMNFEADELENVFILAIRHCVDNEMHERLVKVLREMVKGDAGKGSEADLLDANSGMLKGFEWNRYAALKDVMKAPYTVSVDRDAGTVRVKIPPFVPKEEL